MFDLPEEIAKELLSKQLPPGNSVSRVTKVHLSLHSYFLVCEFTDHVYLKFTCVACFASSYLCFRMMVLHLTIMDDSAEKGVVVQEVECQEEEEVTQAEAGEVVVEMMIDVVVVVEASSLKVVGPKVPNQGQVMIGHAAHEPAMMIGLAAQEPAMTIG